MASEQSSSGPTLNDMTPGTISSGLVCTSSSSTSYVPPLRNDWDLLFQPMFDELLNPPPSVVNQDVEVIAPIAEVIPQVVTDSIGSPSLTTVDQDAHSPTHMGNDLLLGVPILEVTSEHSSSTTSPQSIVQPNHPMTHHNSKWMKDHPLNNIISQLSRPVSTRLQLHEQALFCYYDAFLTSMEPKTYKEALTQASWIEAMQEELNEFERLKEEGIDFEESFTPNPRGIFINQSKYALESLKKYGFESYDPVDTPMVEKSKLDEDREGKAVDPSHYHVSGSAYRKARTCSQKDLSIPSWHY
nr:hypothetical protein [Tanacetum cinerariifolium]